MCAIRIIVAAATLALLAGVSLADELIAPGMSTLRLRSAALVAGDPPVLADVLEFSAADPQLLAAVGDKPASTKPGAVELSHEQVVARLRELGVNMSRVTVSGAMACRIQQATPTDAAAETATTADPLIRAVPAADRVASLADVIRGQIESSLASLGGSVDVDFESAGAEFLALTTPPFDFVVRGPRSPQLGVQEFSVSIRRDGKLQRNVRVGAQVRLTRKVVVASKALNVGVFIRPESLSIAPRTFSSLDEIGIEHSERLVGQQVAEFIPAGQMLRLRDIKQVDLVRRSQAVTIEGDGPIRLHLTGTALDSGGYGETVRVALGDRRGSRREVRGTVVGVATVRIVHEEIQ